MKANEILDPVEKISQKKKNEYPMWTPSQQEEGKDKETKRRKEEKRSKIILTKKKSTIMMLAQMVNLINRYECLIYI